MSDFGYQPPGNPPPSFPAPPPPPPPNMAPPPGYVAYGGPDAVGGYSHIKGLTKAIVILQIITVALSAVVVAVQASLVGKADDYLDGTISRREFEDKLAPFLSLSFLAGLVAIAAVVLLIIWSFRIAKNLQRLGRSGLTWTPGLTIVVWLLGGCTLSIINFFMLNEHWKGSDPRTPPGDPQWRSRPGSNLIVAWFVVALVQIVLAIASGIRTFSGVNFGNSTRNVAESLSDRLPWIIVASVAAIAGAVLMIQIVRQLGARHMSATHEA